MIRIRALAVLILWTAIVWAVPLLGLAAAGHPVLGYLEFPPRTHFVAHADFAWGAFVLFALPAVGALALFALALVNARPVQAPRPRMGLRFPWWGWLGLGLNAASWCLAWQDDIVPPEWRRHVFTPLWLGYILVLNGLVYRRTGRSLLTHRSAWFAALFPVSAVFWWLFEHLNQFAANWHYVGIVARGDWDYFVQATLPFSTVLPAVASTWRWLRQFGRLDAMRLAPIKARPVIAWLALAAGLAALAGIGLWPEALFSMLWLAPLAVLAGLQRLVLGESFFAPLARGDWRPLLQPALAALICGICWELWNWGSLAQWRYSVPYVQRFMLFEMPLLGYAGYLPFGIECALVMDLVARALGRRSVWQ